MPDIVRLIKGLECCRDSMNNNPLARCWECPYNEVSLSVQECRSVLCKDALEVIRHECINEMNLTTIGGWISVKDKIPDNQRPVIVYVPPHVDETKGMFLGYVGMAYYTSLGEGFWCGTDGNLYGAIGAIYPPTYWMPLPEPPQEVSGDG